MSPFAFPHELVMEILSWVPAKDLMRFRCVSKWCSSLVLDPTFVKLHLQHSSNNPQILLGFEDNSYWSVYISKYCAPCSVNGLLHNLSSTIEAFNPFWHDSTLLGVCNGMVCLLDSHKNDDFVEYSVRFWNPATRVTSQLSPCISLRDSLSYSPMFGFGYDGLSDTYKVVLLDNQSQKIEVIVLYMGDNCWRNILTCPSILFLSTQRLHGAYVNATVNWLAFHPCETEKNELVIFSYELKNDLYSYLSMPDDLKEDGPELEVLKGCLCLSHKRNKHFCFWLMKKFGVVNSWTHLLSISFEQLHIPVQTLAFNSEVPLVILCMSEDDNVLLLQRCGKFILCNRRDNRIQCYDLDTERYQFFSYDYAQSLVMPYPN